MSTVGEREIRTQRRVAAFFQDVLGYVRLGDWRDRAGNANLTLEPLRLVHRGRPRRSDRFRELMDGIMPRWRAHRDELNRAPLAHEEWTC